MYDIFCAILLVLMIIAGLVSLFPFSLERGIYSPCFSIPIGTFVFYILYEFSMDKAIPSASVPIRVDVLLVWPLIGFVIFAALIRVGIINTHRRKEVRELLLSARTRRDKIFQIAFVLPSFIIWSTVTYIVWCNI